MVLPFTAEQDEHVAISGYRCCCGRSCARRPAAILPRRWRCDSSRPASLVSNLDFVEGIFGNGGDPYLPENDAALDVAHWTGHTGCVILAPHLIGHPKEGPRTSACRRRHRTAAARWHVLVRRERTVQRRRRLQGHLPRPSRRDGHDHRRQLLRLLQEGSEDADQLRGEPLRPVRRRACRRRDCVSQLRARAGVLCRPHRPLKKVDVRSRQWPARRAASISSRKATRWTAGIPNIFYVPENAEFNVREGSVKWTRDGDRRKV